jgi:inosine-uridine nucleoside N-ribohydrolase
MSQNQSMRVITLGALCGVALAQTPAILDTDIGTDIDDAFALALALKSPELELRGVTTVSADAYGRALIACRFLEAAGRPDIPVAAGKPRRITPERRGQYRYGLADGFTKRPVAELAPEFLYQKLKAAPGRLTIITVGDLTNVARVLKERPEAKAWIRRIVIMGGAVRVGYNGKPPADREWNIRADVAGAQTVFDSGVPLTVAPLDAAVVKLEAAGREGIFSEGGAAGAELKKLYELWGKPEPVLFDAVAVTLSFNESFFGMEDLRIQVDKDGYTREVSGAPNARVATSIDRDAFLEWYLRRMSGSPLQAHARAERALVAGIER